MSTLRKILSMAFLLLSVAVWAQFDIPKKPSTAAAQTSMYDYANLLDATQRAALERKLINYADTTSTQIVVAIVPTIKNENIGTLAPAWAQEWGIGQKDKDNGVFILLAQQERKILIVPGYGLEHILTAGINGEITRNYILPEFKKGDYYAGLDQGTDQLMLLFSGAYKGSRTENSEGGIPVIFLIIGVVALLVILSKFGGGKGNNKGNRRFNGPDLADIIILSRMGRGGGGSFGGGFGRSSGGGGFGGGFGGGGFSGGGAGGSW